MTSKATNVSMKECVAFRDDVTQCDCYLCRKAMAIYKAEQQAGEHVSPLVYTALIALAVAIYYIAAHTT